jgi:predicted nucleic acid-binding protein
MPIVIDANVAIDWFLSSRNDVAEIALDRVVSGGAVVPALWRWEIQDVLSRLSVAGRLKKPVELIRNELRELQIAVDDDVLSLFGDELTVSTRYGLSVYDARIWNSRSGSAYRSRRTIVLSPRRRRRLPSSRFGSRS